MPIPAQVAARPAEEVAAIAGRIGLTTSVQPNVEAALASLHDYVWDRPPRVLICGSLYLAGEVLRGERDAADDEEHRDAAKTSGGKAPDALHRARTPRGSRHPRLGPRFHDVRRRLDPAAEVALRRGADLLAGELAVLEQQQRRDRADAELRGDVAGSRPR